MQCNEVHSYWNLRVTVLRAKMSHSHDFWTESDCYVILYLPTASAKIHRTKTINNTSTPEWNETFHFRIQSHVKNVLEMRIYDEDTIFDPDDLCSIVLFDINNLIPGKKETKVFEKGDPKDQFWVEFELLESEEPPGEYLSNGVIVAAPLSAVDVKVLNTAFQPDAVLKLTGAYREAYKVFEEGLDQMDGAPQLEQTLRYYINRDLETELGVTKPEDLVGRKEAINTMSVSAVQIKPLPPVKHNFTLSLPIGQETIDVQLSAEDRPFHSQMYSPGNDVRIDFDLPVEEKIFMEKRRAVVGLALQKVLNLSSSPEPEKVPVIAVAASGGGTRAMTGMLGSLKGLKEIGLLDTVSYITGVSGSTWAMTKLYEIPNWSHGDMEEPITAMEREITKSFRTAFSMEKLKYYNREMNKMEEEGHLATLVDMWGLVIEHLTHGKQNNHTLSEQQRAVSDGQNPLPIYTAVNMKEGRRGIDTEAEWCEFTPYEVGIAKYGAFVRAEDFGSEFYLGRMIKKLPELRLPHLIGVWSSAFSFNLTQAWKAMTGAAPSWIPWLGKNVNNIEEDNEPVTLDTIMLAPVTSTTTTITNFFLDRPVVAEMYNFMRGFFLHYDYNKHINFNAKDTHPDHFPNHLTPSDSKLKLVDAGHSVNLGCPPVLRPQRAVDVILSLSYSWDPLDVLKVLRETDGYCKDHKIPFPNIDFTELAGEPISELYVFEDKQNPEAPIVVHLPLVNLSYQDFKAPGVAREGEEEMRAGKVDVSSGSSPFKTMNFTYAAEDYRALVDLCTYNVVNNQEGILKALRRAMERKSTVERKTSVEEEHMHGEDSCGHL